ncbi:MAG: hypothetical protein M0Z80_00110 [Treponema sp.]|nr:hypothetical protein [Treponema sp.]
MPKAILVAGLAGIATALLASCWRPIFDEQVSSGALFYDKLGSPFRTIGPVSMYSQMTDGIFLPERIIDAYNGFWVQKESGYVNLSFIKYSGGSYTLSSATTGGSAAGGSLAFADSAYFTTANGQIILGTGSGSATTNLAIYTFTSGSPDTFSYINPSLPADGVTKILGLGATQTAGNSAETLAVIYLNTASALEATNYSYTSNGTALTWSSTTYVLQAGAAGLSSFGRAFIGADGTGSALYYSDGGTSVLKWAWTAGLNSAPATISMRDPLVAVLSNGILVCQGKDYLDAYRPDGSEIFSRPAGSVRFVQEVDSSGTDYCIFAQTLLAPQDNNGNNQVYIELWRIPTGSFSSLGN